VKKPGLLVPPSTLAYVIRVFSLLALFLSIGNTLVKLITPFCLELKAILPTLIVLLAPVLV